MPPVATGVLSLSGRDRSLVCLSVFFLFLLVISAVVWPTCKCVGTVVSWIVCPSLSVESPVDAFIVCVRLSFVSLFRLFTSSLMDSFIVCVRLSYVSLLDCVHCHLWTVVLSASLCSFLPLCPQVVHTVTY